MRSVILLSVLLVCAEFGTGTASEIEGLGKALIGTFVIFFVMDMIELGKRK